MKLRRIVIRTHPIAWSPRKLAEMRIEILKMLGREGAPNCEWTVEDVTDDTPIAAPRPMLNLRCVPCAHDWTAEFFEPCPKCGKREIQKVDPVLEPMWKCSDCDHEFRAEKRRACPNCGSYVHVGKAA